MGAVNTTYTFTPTDVITSSKMNDIIDQTTMTSTAILGSTLQVTTSGQLAVNAQGITSNELAAASVTQAKIGTNVAGTGPFIYATTSVSTSVPTGFPSTKITLGIVSPDTNNNFSTANSRFTPTVAGYYQINGAVGVSGAGANSLTAYIHKNGFASLAGSAVQTQVFNSVTSIILHCNGSTDYLELFASHSQGTNVAVTGAMNACLIRAA